MKKLAILLGVFALTLQFSSCKSETKKETKPEVEAPKSYAFSLKKATNEVNFTAYKTTEKVPVKGMFKTVKIVNGGEGDTVKEAINGAEFSIPIGSIETNDSSRNLKIQTFFFQVMEATGTLKGKLFLDDDTKGHADFIMNGVTQKLPFTYSITDKVFTMDATMDINLWNGQAAIESLNTACKALHTGADGVSKTWNEVAINIVSKF